ncbi:MAG TPA: MmgE/PrpD family protein [Candidatus Acidoferrales bacterium]|nr:MmgE/PrpD family protein [Candidatus Acidoferrales bacterium]
MTGSPAVSQGLAHFASSPIDIPESAMAAGRGLLINTVALAVAGSRGQAAESAWAGVRALGTPELAGILGRPERLSPIWAALVNGIAAASGGGDDIHDRSQMRVGASVVPAALAVAEWRDRSVGELVAAIVIGAEVGIRVGIGLGPSHRDRGWEVSSTCGVIGAAVAAGRMLGLDTPAMLMAVGLSATQAAGLRAAAGTMTAAFQMGKAASNGVESALFAATGLTTTPISIEGRRGLAALTSTAPDYEATLDGLGERWEVEQVRTEPLAGAASGGQPGAEPADRQAAMLDRARALVQPALGTDFERLITACLDFRGESSRLLVAASFRGGAG